MSRKPGWDDRFHVGAAPSKPLPEPPKRFQALHGGPIKPRVDASEPRSMSSALRGDAMQRRASSREGRPRSNQSGGADARAPWVGACESSAAELVADGPSPAARPKRRSQAGSAYASAPSMVVSSAREEARQPHEPRGVGSVSARTPRPGAETVRTLAERQKNARLEAMQAGWNGAQQQAAQLAAENEQLRTHNKQLLEYGEGLRAQLAALHEAERAQRAEQRAAATEADRTPAAA